MSSLEIKTAIDSKRAEMRDLDRILNRESASDFFSCSRSRHAALFWEVLDMERQLKAMA